MVDLSNFYLDIIKDRLYIEKAGGIERRSAQSAMYKILEGLVLLLAPALSFSAEEIWQYMPHTKGHDTKSVSFNEMPEFDKAYENFDINKKYEKILLLREDAKKALEEARAKKIIGASLEAQVTIYCSDEAFEFVSSVKDELVTIFIASKVEIIKGKAPSDASKGENFEGKFKIVQKAGGQKCQRC